MTDVEKTGKGEAASRMGSKVLKDQSLCEIVIQRKNKTPTTKFAKKGWQNQEHIEITEACVEDLGFSILELNGEKRKSIRLRWRPKNRPKLLEDDFLIIPNGEHEIVLGMDAFDKWVQASNPGVYPCFPNKVPKEIRKMREEQDKIRHDGEIAADRERWLEVLEKTQQAPLKDPPAPRL